MIRSKLANRYELLGELGKGGMATVYRAADGVLGRQVAVKVVSTAGLSDAAVERFEREARLVGRLDHPAIVPIFDFGRDGDRMFFVMPVLDGTTLHRLLRDRPPSLGQILEIAAQVAEALDHSASRGVVHRDIKPENVMVALESAPTDSADTEGAESGEDAAPGAAPGAVAVRRVWVMDFGLALGRTTTRLTKTGNLPGTLTYLSPEQILSAGLDGRSDLYSVGVILYEYLSGKPPFTGTPAAVLYRIVHEQPAGLAERGVDPRLEELVLSCLAKRPEDRVQSGRELAAELRRLAREIDLSGSVEVDPGRKRTPGRPPVLPLVGRDAEMSEMRRRLDLSLRGDLQCVVVAGHPGTGKTRLLQELEDEADRRGILVLHGRFAEREGTYPYQAFCELIQDYFRRRHGRFGSSSPASASPSASSTSSASSAPTQRSHAPQNPLSGEASGETVDEHPAFDDLASDLVALFPALAEIPELTRAADGAPETEAHLADDPTRLYEIVARALGRLSGGAPMILLIEQLHAADASIDLVQYLLRRLSATPTLLVATERPSAVGRRHPLALLTRRLRDDPCFCRLELAPLDAASHRALVEELLGRAPVTDDLARRLHEATEGNPFFTRELLGALFQAGDVSADAGGSFALARSGVSGEGAITPEDLPETIQHAVETRLERLDEVPRKVLEAASVLGKQLLDRDLRALLEHPASGLGHDPDAADEAVDELIELGLLEEERHGRGDRLRFGSGLVRDVVYGQIPRRRRRRLHGAHARRLEARYAERRERAASALLHHFAEADDAPKAIEYGRLHAEISLAAYCWDDAAYAARQALDFADDEVPPGRDPVHGTLRLLLARALAAKGELDEALREGERALQALRDLDAHDDGARLAAEAAHFLARTAWQARRIDDTRRWLGQGVELARAELETNSSNVSDEDGSDEAGSEEARSDEARSEEARSEEARSEKARARLADLLTLAATLANLGGDPATAHQCLDEARRIRQSLVPPRPEVAKGGVLRVGMATALTSDDPANTLSAQDIEIAGQVFEPLLTPEASDGAFGPGLCASWSRSEDGLVYHFDLPDDLVFSDGTTVDAAAVKSSLEAAARVSGGRLSAAVDVIAGAASFLDGSVDDLAGISALSSTRLSITLSAPLAAFPASLSDPRTGIARRDVEPPVGTGPFRLCAADPAQRSEAEPPAEPGTRPPRLERNPRYRGPAAHLDAIEFSTFPSSRDISAAWRAGDVDVARDLAPAEVFDELRRRRRQELREASQKNLYFALFHRHGPRTKDAALRRVLARVIDPRRLVWSRVPRFATPALGWLPPGILGHDPAAESEVVDLESSIAAMDAFRPLPVQLKVLVHAAFADQYPTVVEALTETWELLGCAIEQERLTLDRMEERLAEVDDVDVFLGRWWPDYVDPDAFYFGALHSQVGLYRELVGDQAVDLAIEAARAETDPARREAQYRDLEAILSTDGLIRPLFHEIEYRLVAPRVGGFEPSGRPPFVAYERVGLLPSSDEMADRRTVPSGRLAIPIRSPVDSLDPVRGPLADASEIFGNVFETLTRMDEGAVAVPHLAESLEAEDGGTRWRVKLRDVRFHDGRRLTARDVRHSFSRLVLRADDDFREAFVYQLGLAGAGLPDLGDSSWMRSLGAVHIVSSTELVLESRKPLPYFPELLTHSAASIVPEDTEDIGTSWRDGAIGTGPYRLVGFEPGRRAVLAAHDDYWRPGMPRVSELAFELGVDSAAALEGFRSGAYAMLSGLPPHRLDELVRDPDLAAGLAQHPAFSTCFAAYLPIDGPLADPDTRRAVDQVLRRLRPELAASLGRVGQAASHLVPPGLLTQERRPGRRDEPAAPAGALQGLRLRVGFHPVFASTYAGTWERIRAALEAAGVETTVVAREVGDVLGAIGDRGVDLMINRWIADFPDPSSFGQMLATGPMGRMWRDRELQRILDLAGREPEPGIRHSLFRQVEDRLADETLLLPLFHEQAWRLTRPEVRGLRLRYGWPEVAYEELHL